MLKPSTRKNKKWMLTIDNKTVHFGHPDYEDYTMHKDKDRRQRYLNRNKRYLNDREFKPATAALRVLWGDSTDINVNLRKYLKFIKGD